tara:strand:+ start:173 stop:391 length:219 start_codon:yes stop_codon:yes gene_type:complete
MAIDWLPLGLIGSVFFWTVFIILGLLIPFFIFISTFTLWKILHELKKISKYLELAEQKKERETLGQNPRSND